MSKIKGLFVFFFIPGLLCAQGSALDNYIKQGIENNITLQEKHLDYQKSLNLLKQAKSYYFPNISFHARYSIADGGRVIDLPIGDLLNPVYSTLNQLTAMNQFPQIENEEIAFLREKEHETKVRLIQPLFNGQIYYNSKIKEAQSHYYQSAEQAYKFELISEIKVAYYNYLKSNYLLDILKSHLKVVEENIEVNQKLFKNDKITYENVLRSKSALSEWYEKEAEAKEQNEKAKLWFNFLINRELNDEILTDKGEKGTKITLNTEDLSNSAGNRFELQQIDNQILVSIMNEKLQKSGYWPELSLVFDFGLQGETYKFGQEDDYYIASLVLEWPIFQGFRRKQKVQEAQIMNQQAELAQQKVQKQITIQVSNALNEYLSAIKKYEAVKQKLNTEKESWRIINKKYKEGLVNQLTHTNALETYYSAQQQEVIAKYDVLIQKAKLIQTAALEQDKYE